MDIEPVDPRDVEWEVEYPVYRIYFWHQPAAPPGIARPGMGYQCEEHRVTGASDVHEVITWARASAAVGRTFTLYVEHVQGGSPGLIRLAGEDPTDPN